MAEIATETEIKYDAPEGTALPRLDDLPQVAGTSRPDADQLEAEYYDTGDLRLIRAGVTLRRRRGGSDPGWHLKLPAGPDTRQEIRLPLGRTGRRVPRELAGLVRVHTRGEALEPVVQMTTRRQRVILLGQSGESLAEVAADDVSAQTLGEATALTQWREVEVELTGGDRRLLAAAGKQLRRGGLRPAGHSAKLERALGIEPARPAARQPLTRSSPARDVVLAYLRIQAGTLKTLDPMVRRDEPDSVHQMRVTARRLRSTLQSFPRVISRSGTRQLTGELKWLGAVLGEARDGEVLTSHLAGRIGQSPAEQVIGPVAARVQAHFAPRRAAARAGLLAVLDSQRYFALLDAIDLLIAEPPLARQAAAPAGDALPAALRRAYRKAARRMKRARRAPPGRPRDTALHEARKAAKRARYAGEAAALVSGKKARRFTRRMKKVQSVLGDHQDTVIARALERELGMSAHLAGENAFSYGLLYERDACEAGRLQIRARRAWKKASRRRHRMWMS